VAVVGDDPREIPRPAGENAGLRDDAEVVVATIPFICSWHRFHLVYNL